jgi:hypothetical protein
MRSLDQIRRFTGIAGVVGVLAVTAGCGGGGGGSAPSTSGFAIPNDLTVLKPGVTSALTTNLAAWTPGDEWYYSVSGTLRKTGNVLNKLQTSYLGLTVDTPTGGDPGSAGIDAMPGALALTSQRYLYYADNTLATSVSKDFTAPDGSGNKTLIGDTFEASGNDEYAGNTLCDLFGFVLYPNSFTDSTGFSGSSTFIVPTGVADTVTPACSLGGSTLTNQEQASFTALDKETVTVGAGTFQVWKVRSTRVLIHQGITDVQVAYWAPQIGSYVRLDSERDGPDGHESFSYQLFGFKSQSTATVVEPLVRKP